jgi:protein required for attachment to host cells
MDKDWIVVADSARARLYTRASHSGELDEQLDLVQPTARLNEGDLTSDRPGRTFDSSGQGRHAMSAPESKKHHETVAFAAEIAHHLEGERAKGALRDLVLVAPPEFLGLLREALSDACGQHVVHSLAKNLTRESPQAVREAIKT